MNPVESPAAPARPFPAQATVLVVDDEPHVRALLTDVLTSVGLDVIAAADGVEGLHHARIDRPDLVILDVMMPGMSGMQVGQALREDPATAHLPIIMLTARGSELSRSLGFISGVDRYMTKPFEVRGLLSEVHALLAGRPAGTPGAGRHR
ncbi:response regulator transcription factor [Planomonospora corallina]|uniref:Response regulator transcription factor n=1 Tax=Planomonospora corallina TaxID=1806052 RepID=A0ABV8I1U9_9ACTN